MIKNILIICLVISAFVVFPGFADRLPNASGVSNFQQPISSNLQIVGMMDSKTKVQMDTYNYNRSAGFLAPGESYSSVMYSKNMKTNGGYLSEAKRQLFDEGSQVRGYNVDTQGVTTYASDSATGSKLTTDEKLDMSVSGNWSRYNTTFRNVLVQNILDGYLGGFNSDYSAASQVDLTTGQLATNAKARSVGKDVSVPAAIAYDLNIHPDSSTGLPFAEGSASTVFSVDNEEGYNTTNNLSSTKSMSDETSVNGLIFTFGKAFDASSGIQPES